MRIILTLITVVTLIILMPGIVVSQDLINEKLLNLNKSEITQNIGQPLKETHENNLTVLWYNSEILPDKADFIFLQDEKSILISKDISSENLTLAVYLQRFGNPDNVLTNNDSASDSIINYLHIWQNEKLTVVSQGITPSADVQRLEYFLDYDAVLHRWNLNESNIGEVQLASNNNQSNNLMDLISNRTVVLSLAGILLTLLGGIIGITLIYKSKKKKRSPATPTPYSSGNLS